MREKERFTIPLEYENQIKSLCWVDDCLIDWVTGTTFRLNGEIIHGERVYGYRFDAAISLNRSGYTVIYEEFGTKGIILKDGQQVREINRSYYCAEAYEYPVTLFRHKGVTCLVHCPDAYNILEIEVAETGERLTREGRPEDDFFQSRIRVSPDGKWLLSAGWIWHPLDTADLYDLSEGLADPPANRLFWDDGDPNGTVIVEVSNASFMDNSNVVFSGIIHSGGEDEGEIAIATCDPVTGHVLSQVKLSVPTGQIVPLNEDHVVTLFGNPRILNLKTGKVIQSWPDIPTETRNSSIRNAIDWEHWADIAVDQENKRIAVGLPGRIEVLLF